MFSQKTAPIQDEKEQASFQFNNIKDKAIKLQIKKDRLKQLEANKALLEEQIIQLNVEIDQEQLTVHTFTELTNESILSNELPNDYKKNAEILITLLQLIKNKFSTKIHGSINLLNIDSVQLEISPGWPSKDQASMSVINYFEALGDCTITHGFFNTETLNISIDKCNKAIEGLKLLANPTKEDKPNGLKAFEPRC